MITSKKRADRTPILLLTFLLIFSPLSYSISQDTTEMKERRISLNDYRDKMMAGWIGQMVGVGWGAPTEFAYTSRIIPVDEVPQWKPELVNVYGQDDLYVEMTFLRSMEEYGIDVSINQAGIDFANSSYMLWVANHTARENLRKGIAPPNSGHPAFGNTSDAIDYQIEADFSGLIAPGLPNTVIDLGNKFGRIMNYGDGLYGGVFVGAMYAEAFFEDDIMKIIEAGLEAIPEGSQYAEAVRDVIEWHSLYPDDFDKTWGLINEKYHKNPDYRRYTSSEPGAANNIDAKINGAYIIMGLLYGNGDPDLTIIESMRCGQDSDCNPSNAAGILYTTMGFSSLPDKYISALDNETKFSFTEYTFPDLIDVCEKLAIELVINAGGRVEKDTNGEDVLVIPVSTVIPGTLEQSYDPGPISDNEFTKEELSKIKGSKFFRFVVLIIVILVFVLLSENWRIKAAAIFIPYLVVVGLLELLKSGIDPNILGTVNVIVIFQSIAAVIAILLMLSDRLRFTNRIVRLIIAFIIVFVIGIIGSLGGTDGRYMASTTATLAGYVLLAVLWLIGIVLTMRFSFRKYTRLRFSLIAFASLFIIDLLGVFVFLLGLSTLKGPWAAIGYGPGPVLIGTVVLTVILYLLTLPFMILSFTNSVYENKLLGLARGNWSVEGVFLDVEY